MNPGQNDTLRVNSTQTPGIWAVNGHLSSTASQEASWGAAASATIGSPTSSSTLSGSQESLVKSQRGSSMSLATLQTTQQKSTSYGLVDETVLAENPHIKMEQFRVDRRKLEGLISTGTGIEEINAAIAFFAKIMNNTNTVVEWPRYMKVNGKYQKDPIVKVYGLPENIAWAKGIILESLATRGPLLRLKIHVCKLDHPHIIGRRGHNINAIMKSTETRIHFADLDKADKSNSHHVAILGAFGSLEKARADLRAATPLIMKLKVYLKKNALRRGLAEHLQKLQKALNVEITTIRASMDKMYLITVKGTEQHNQDVKVAVQSLISTYLTSFEAKSVYMDFLIAPEVRATLNENAHSVLNAIRRKTMTEIDILPSEEKQMSKVVVKGTLFGIHEAKKAILGIYPVELIFDLKEERDKEIVGKLCRKYGLECRIKSKEAGQTFRATTKTKEQFVHRLYAVYEEFLDAKNATMSNGSHQSNQGHSGVWTPGNIADNGRTTDVLQLTAPAYEDVSPPRVSPDPSDYSDDWVVMHGSTDEFSPEDLEVASYMAMPHCPSPPPLITDPGHVVAPAFNRAPGAERRRMY